MPQQTIHLVVLALLLSLNSCDQAPPGSSEKRERMLKRFDKDGDGVLNTAERAEARAAREMRQRRGNTPTAPTDKEQGLSDEQKKRVLQRFDSDGDGQLNAEEREQARQAIKKRRASRMQ